MQSISTAIAAFFAFLASLLNPQINSNIPKIFPTLTPKPTPTPIVAVLHVLSGTAKLDTQTLTAPDSQPLSSGNLITTDAKSVAQIDYQLGTVTRIGPSTSIKYTDIDSLSQTLGQIFVRFTRVLGIRDRFSLETPTAIATVRGTSYLAFVNPNRRTKLVGLDDPVELFTPSSIATVSAGIQAVSAPGTQKIATSSAQLDFSETTWLDYNRQLDATGLTDPAATLFRPTPTSTTTPTPKATPTSAGPPPLQGPPSSGLSTVTVTTALGNFRATILSLNLASTRIITDTVEENNCFDNCPVSPLKDLVVKNGGFAGVNGVYFCPDTYPDCSGKKNSHDFPVFNSRLHRWIPDNTLSWGGRSVFYVDGGGAQYNQSSAGIGGGMDAGVINYPGLVDGAGNVQIDDNQSGAAAKQAARATKVGIGRTDTNHVLVVIASSVNLREFAEVFKSLGAKGALNLDSGGSIALYYNGRYVFGPGRNLPTAIVFVRK